MTLAKVVHKMSNDRSFAAQLQLNPEAALRNNGYRLSSEEIAFLSQGLSKSPNGNGHKVRIADIGALALSWREG